MELADVLYDSAMQAIEENQALSARCRRTLAIGQTGLKRGSGGKFCVFRKAFSAS